MTDLERDIDAIQKLIDAEALLPARQAWQRIRARIAELEADAERYRWLRTATYLDGETLAVFVIDEASEIANKGEWLSDEQLDDAIDAARKVANHRFLLRRKACKV